MHVVIPLCYTPDGLVLNYIFLVKSSMAHNKSLQISIIVRSWNGYGSFKF